MLRIVQWAAGIAAAVALIVLYLSLAQAAAVAPIKYAEYVESAPTQTMTAGIGEQLDLGIPEIRIAFGGISASKLYFRLGKNETRTWAHASTISRDGRSQDEVYGDVDLDRLIGANRVLHVVRATREEITYAVTTP